ncbi:MerR family transcriptional regulator [Lachnospiraceae bacterium]|nr:MerR family transcriptional regulator [Lachnospiraceae bacterium]
MYQISQFSKISGLTVKALRYYDEQGILKPSYRDRNTLYRYYDENDLKKAQLIGFLRSLDFSILEIKEVLEMVKNEVDLTSILREKIANIEENILREKELINNISGYLSPDVTKTENQTYKITLEDIPTTLVASIRFWGKYSEIGEHIPLLYKAVQGNANGPAINCYYDEECVEQADMELCLPTKKQIAVNTINCKYLPAVKAVCTTHYGSYERLHIAYKALFDYVNKHGITVIAPFREIYEKSPGMIFKGNPENYVTKILFPYKIL